MRGNQGPGIPATPLVRTPVTTWPIGHCTVSTEPFLGTVPAAATWPNSHRTPRTRWDTCRESRFLGRCPPVCRLRLAGVARLSRVLPPLNHHRELTLRVALKRHPARTRGHQSHSSPVASALGLCPLLRRTHQTLEKPPCNTWWREEKRTVQRRPLCLRRECRLRHSPTVVAGSSLDCRCTGTKGKCLM